MRTSFEWASGPDLLPLERGPWPIVPRERLRKQQSAISWQQVNRRTDGSLVERRFGFSGPSSNTRSRGAACRSGWWARYIQDKNPTRCAMTPRDRAHRFSSMDRAAVFYGAPSLRRTNLFPRPNVPAQLSTGPGDGGVRRGTAGDMVDEAAFNFRGLRRNGRHLLPSS